MSPAPLRVPVVTVEIPGLTWRIAWGEDCWVAYCPLLNLSESGDTFEDAVTNAVAATRDLLDVRQEDGSLAGFLETLGADIGLNEGSGPVRWDVPFEIKRVKDLKALAPRS